MTTLATTTEFDFSVVFDSSTTPPTTYPNGGTPAGTSNSGAPAVATPQCNQGNIIVSGICQVLSYLFMPKQADFTQFSGLYNNIKSKPPFGWFYQSVATMSGISATGTPATDLSQADLLHVFFDPIKTGFTMLIYFLLGMWIFKKLGGYKFG